MADSDVNDNKIPKTLWELYNKKAKLADRELIKDWETSINGLLVFAAIFLAVLTAICVESRKLLEEDPQESIKQILLHIAAKMDNNTQTAVPAVLDYKAPRWAVVVNGFFFASLTSSMLAAIGAAACLQWVGGYASGLENTTVPLLRALRRHYRFRGTTRWYMRRMITALLLALYLSLLLFFMGLVLWFFRIHPTIGALPLAGLVIWAIGSIITTILSVIFPSAPFRTPMSEALFRVVWPTTFSIWWCYQTLRAILNSFIRFKRSISSKDSSLIARVKESLLVQREEVIREVTMQIRTKFPWVPPGRIRWLGVHMEFWEKYWVRNDDTLPVSALAWLANSIDLTDDSGKQCMLILNELKQLPPKNMEGWGEHECEAPWVEIFTLGMKYSSEGEQGAPGSKKETLTFLVQLLEAKFVRSKLFAPIANQLGPELITAFIEYLNRNPLMTKAQPLITGSIVTDSTLQEEARQLAKTAKARLKSITLLLSSPNWTHMKCDQPSYPMLEVVLDSLDVVSAIRTHMKLELSTAIRDPPGRATEWINSVAKLFGIDVRVGDAEEAYENASTSWIFTNCTYQSSLPNSEAVSVIANSFRRKDARICAISYYVKFVDTVLSGFDQEWAKQMRWMYPSSMPSPEQQLSMVRLLTDHVIRFQAIFDDGRRLPDHPLLKQLKHPAIRLVICAASGSREPAPIPNHDEPIWKDHSFLHAVKFWCGRRYGWTKEERQIVTPKLNPDDLRVIQMLFDQEDKSVKEFAKYMVRRYAQSWQPDQCISRLGSLLDPKVVEHTDRVRQELVYWLTGFYPSGHRRWARVRETGLLGSAFCDAVWGSVWKVVPQADLKLREQVLGVIPRVLDNHPANGNYLQISQLRACLLIARTVSDYFWQLEDEIKKHLEHVRQSLERLMQRLRNSSDQSKRDSAQDEAVTTNADSSDSHQQLLAEIQDLINSITSGNPGEDEKVDKRETVEEPRVEEVPLNSGGHGVEEAPWGDS